MAEVLVVCIDDEDVREGVVELAVDLGGQGQLPFNSSNRIRRTTIAMLLMMIVTKRAQSNQQTNTRESTVVELYNIKKWIKVIKDVSWKENTNNKTESITEELYNIKKWIIQSRIRTRMEKLTIKHKLNQQSKDGTILRNE